MKDFGLKSYQRKKKKSFKSVIKSVKKILSKLFKSILITLGILCFLIILFWISLPHLVSLPKNTNIVFINNNKSSNEDEILFASFNAETQKIRAYLLKSDYEVTIFNKESRGQELRDIGIVLANLKEGEYQSNYFSWILGQIVEDVVVVSSLEKIIDVNIAKIMRENFFSDFSIKDLAQAKKNLQLFMFARKATYEYIDPQKGQLPSSVVLPRTCSIAVINTTDISGYAQSMTDLLEKSGSRVVRVDSADQGQRLDQTTFAFDKSKEECIGLITTIADHLLLGEPAKINQDQTQSLLNRFRSDLVIFLNDDQLFWRLIPN